MALRRTQKAMDRNSACGFRSPTLPLDLAISSATTTGYPGLPHFADRGAFVRFDPIEIKKTDDWREEMKMTFEFRPFPRACDVGVAVVVAALALLMAVPAGAIDLSGSSGNYSLNLDTTLSWGARWRMEDRDPAIISPFEGGTAWSVNGDDGNLNFDKGLVSNSLKATIDLGFSYDGWDVASMGFFARGSGFYDYVLEKNCCARTELTQEALDWAGSRAELLDAYAFWQFPLGKGRGEIRAGRQVLNWGESTFIQGGLSVINPVDVSALRVPGSELREAFRPLGMVWASFDLSQNLSIEGFYQ